MKYRITVFTPTYNRAYILHNLYDSLRRQSFRDFEWLIVDDGSEDNTEALVSSWQSEDNHFDIIYIKQENGGKHKAINNGLMLASGELFFTVDSDDYLTDDALYKIDLWEKSLPRDGKYCGVAGNLGYAENRTINPPFKDDYLDKSHLECYTYKENNEAVLSGERAYAFYTDVHKKYLYPIFPGERFMTEGVAWNRMARDGYKMRFYKDIIWVFEYKSDGLTMAGGELFIKNPKGYGLFLSEQAKFLHKTPLDKLKMYYTFTCDLSGRHDPETIADSIGCSRLLVKFIIFIRKMFRK